MGLLLVPGPQTWGKKNGFEIRMKEGVGGEEWNAVMIH